MRFLFSILVILLSVSCSGTKKSVKIDAPVYPDWIQNRPLSNDYYIGIAKALKNKSDYSSIAKQNALMDLSSEISVKLSSASIFHQVDKGDRYREDYQSLIEMESQKDLEGYDLVATWENEKEYWLYYKLSKSKWAEIRSERKNKAINEAYSYYKLALDYQLQENVPSAVNYAVKALDVLSLYMDGVLRHPDLEYPIDVYCFELLSNVYNSISYESEFNLETREFLIGSDLSLESFDIYIGKENIPFKIRSSFKGSPDYMLSNSSGVVKVSAQSMDVYRKEHFVNFILDWDAMLKAASPSDWIRDLVDFPESSFKISVTLVWPKISITSEELNLGQECAQSILLNESLNYFQDKGFEIVDETNADYQINIKSNTYRGLTNNRMHSALLQYEFVVKDASGNIVFQQQKRELKGVQSNFPSAGINAYERSLDDFKWDILRPFIKQLVGE